MPDVLHWFSNKAVPFLHLPPSAVQVKMWVQLLIPRIEDGNNFGVSIQVNTQLDLYELPGCWGGGFGSCTSWESFLCIEMQNCVSGSD